MSATLNEHEQWMTSSGNPVVNGKVFFGVAGSDPVAVPKTIFSDPLLTTPIANPQLTDSDGRTVEKVYIDGTYSIKLEDSQASQLYLNLDNGTSASAIMSVTLDNIVGATTIAATSSIGLTSYTDKLQFVFKTVSTGSNAGAVTLDVDEIGTRSVVKNKDQAIVKGEFEPNQIVIVVFNEQTNVFEWVNQNNRVIDFSKGSSVSSSATTDIWSVTGNTIHVTGTNQITSFGTAPNVGARRSLIFDDVLLLTNSANLILPNGLDFLTAQDNRIEVYADTLTVHYATPLFQRGILPRGHLSGLGTSNSSGDLSHDILIAEGIARDKTNIVELILSAPLIKRIDASWGAGNNAGGRATGVSLLPNTWYHMHLVDTDAGGFDVGFDTSFVANNLLNNTPGIASRSRRLGAVKTNGSSNIFAYVQVGDEWRWAYMSDHQVHNGNITTSAITVAAQVPPGLKILAHLQTGWSAQASNAALIISDPDTPNNAADPLLAGMNINAQADDADNTTDNPSVFTNILGQVRLRTSSTDSIGIVARGWTDTRGRFD